MLQVTDKDGGEEDNKDEAIVPTDMNLICDDDLRLILGPMAQVRTRDVHAILRTIEANTNTKPQPIPFFSYRNNDSAPRS